MNTGNRTLEEKRAHLESLKVPTVHLNGSCAIDLARKLEDAYLALNEACRALNDCTPHGRDYETQESGSFAQAYREHMSRGRQLCEVMDELCHIGHNVREQNEFRK